jgi:hypothetical protein
MQVSILPGWKAPVIQSGSLESMTWCAKRKSDTLWLVGILASIDYDVEDGILWMTDDCGPMGSQAINLTDRDGVRQGQTKALADYC